MQNMQGTKEDSLKMDSKEAAAKPTTKRTGEADGSEPVAATTSTSSSPQQSDSFGAQASGAELATLANTSARRGNRRMKRKQSRVRFPGHISGSRMLRLHRFYKAAEKRARKKFIRLKKKYERILERITRLNDNLQMQLISDL